MRVTLRGLRTALDEQRLHHSRGGESSLPILRAEIKFRQVQDDGGAGRGRGHHQGNDRCCDGRARRLPNEGSRLVVIGVPGGAGGVERDELHRKRWGR